MEIEKEGGREGKEGGKGGKSTGAEMEGEEGTAFRRA